MTFNAKEAAAISMQLRDNVRSDIEFDIVYSLINRECRRGRGHTYVPVTRWADGTYEAYVLEGRDKNPYYMEVRALSDDLRKNGFLVDDFYHYEYNGGGNMAMLISWEY